jgi:hypothetical protein
MLTTDYEIDQDRCEAQGQAALDWYLDGKTDGAFGIKPRYLQEEYLQGWFASLKEALQDFPRDRTGEIQYAAPQPTSTSALNPLWEVGAALRAEWRLPEIGGFSPDEEF